MGCVLPACWPYPSMGGVFPGVSVGGLPVGCLLGGVCPGGVYPSMQRSRHPHLWTGRHLWKHNLCKLRLRAVITFEIYYQESTVHDTDENQVVDGRKLMTDIGFTINPPEGTNSIFCRNFRNISFNQEIFGLERGGLGMGRLSKSANGPTGKMTGSGL